MIGNNIFKDNFIICVRDERLTPFGCNKMERLTPFRCNKLERLTPFRCKKKEGQPPFGCKKMQRLTPLGPKNGKANAFRMQKNAKNIFELFEMFINFQELVLRFLISQTIFLSFNTSLKPIQCDRSRKINASGGLSSKSY